MGCAVFGLSVLDEVVLDILKGDAIPFCLFLTFVRFLSLPPSRDAKGCLIGEDKGTSVAMAPVLNLEGPIIIDLL